MPVRFKLIQYEKKYAAPENETDSSQIKEISFNFHYSKVEYDHLGCTK